MKEKITAGKGKTAAGIVIVAAAVIATVLFFFLRKDGGYRTIKIYEVQGNVTVEREKTGKMDAYENLLLQNKDKLQVGDKSGARLKMDDDKYAVVAENTKLDILAEGDSENSLTELVVETGTVTTDIEKKLSEDSSYKVSTPNSVMAVRGTIFEVNVKKGSDGTATSSVKVFRGKVGFSPKDKDGNVLDEIPVEAGKELSMKGREKPVVSDITDYSNPFDEGVEEAVGQASDSSTAQADSGTGDSQETANEVSSAADADDEENAGDVDDEEDTDDAEDEDINADEDDTSVSDDADAADTDSSGDKNISKKKTSSGDKSSKKDGESKKKDGESKKKDGESKKKAPKATRRPVPIPVPAPPIPSADTGAHEQMTNAPAVTDQPNGIVTATPNLTPSEVPAVICTVTFKYQGKVFASQKVKQGEKIQKPRLIPAEKGEWDYDFSKPVTGDITIEYKTMARNHYK